MHKEFSWTEEELLEAGLQAKRLPVQQRKKRRWMAAAIAVLGLFCGCAGLLKLYLLISDFLEILSSDGIRAALLDLFLWSGANTFLVLLQLTAAAAAAYTLFFRDRHRIKKMIRQNKNRVLAPKTLDLNGNLLRIDSADTRFAWTLDRSMTVWFTRSYVYCLDQKEGGEKTVCWMIPRRIFGEGEEAAFREELAGSCEIKDDLRKIDKLLSRGDLTALSAAIAVHLFSFALELVALQELPGRIAFNYWIDSVFLCPFFLLVYLIEAIRSFPAESGTKAGKTLNLILVALSLLVFIPFGAAYDNAYSWAGIMGLVLVFQLRRLWLVSRDCGRGEDGFHGSLLKAGGCFLIPALLMDVLFLLLLLIFKVSIREVHVGLEEAHGLTIGSGTALKGDAYTCAAMWIRGTVFTCAGAFCLLIERAVSAWKQRKAVLSFCLLILVLTAFFFLRKCPNLALCFVWIALIAGLLLWIRRMNDKGGGVR